MNAARVAIPLLLLAARVAAADPQADAEKFYGDGQAAYDDKRYDDAITAWQKSYDLTHLPALLFNIAQAHRLAGHCTKAVESYTAFIKADPSSAQRADAESRLKEIQPCPAAAVTVTAKITPPPPKPVEPAAPNHHLGGALVIGVGGALAVGGAIFGQQAQSAANDVKAACSPHCEWTSALAAKDSDGRRDVDLQWGLYGGAAVAVIAGVILYRHGSHERAPVAIVPRTDGATLSYVGSW